MNRLIPMVATIALAACLVDGHAAPVPGQGTWVTTLQARDLTGDGVSDAFFDTVLDVTWLADTSGIGSTNWVTANAWATNLVVGGINGWRLPTMVDTGSAGCDLSWAGGTDCGFNVQTISADGSLVFSEMAHMWYVALGNKAVCALGDLNCNPGLPQPGYGLTNTGEFEGLQADGYWTGLIGPTGNDGVWYFATGGGLQGQIANHALLRSLAVHDGDIGASLVPEPQTFALVLVSLLGLGVSCNRRARGVSRTA